MMKNVLFDKFMGDAHKKRLKSSNSSKGKSSP